MLHVHTKSQMPGVKMTLQVHDELVLKVPAREARQAGELVREAMDGAFPMTVSLKVDVDRQELG